MAVPRRRLRAAEQRALSAALEEAGKEAAEHLAELQRIGIERVLPSVPAEARSEAMRAWINYVLGGLAMGTEFQDPTSS
jgi:hypothetical protein